MVAGFIVAGGIWLTQKAAIERGERIANLEAKESAAKDDLSALQRQDFEDSLRDKDIQIKNLEKETQVLTDANLKLEAAISPRRLTADQERALASLGVFANRTVEVKSFSSDTEGLILASQICEALKKSHINVLDNRLTMQPAGSIMFGVSVTGSNKDLVDALKNILSRFASVSAVESPNRGFSASVSFGVVTPSTPPAATVTVGPKPIK